MCRGVRDVDGPMAVEEPARRAADEAAMREEAKAAKGAEQKAVGFVLLSMQLVSGELLTEDGLYDPTDTVRDLLRHAEAALGGRRRCVGLVSPEGKILRVHASIEACALMDGDVLTALLHSGPPPIEPVVDGCEHPPIDVIQGVTIGAQHEGWGRKWSTCSYACAACSLLLAPEGSVVTCRRCKAFWHSDCAAAVAASDAARLAARKA